MLATASTAPLVCSAEARTLATNEVPSSEAVVITVAVLASRPVEVATECSTACTDCSKPEISASSFSMRACCCALISSCSCSSRRRSMACSRKRSTGRAICPMESLHSSPGIASSKAPSLRRRMAPSRAAMGRESPLACTSAMTMAISSPPARAAVASQEMRRFSAVSCSRKVSISSKTWATRLLREAARRPLDWVKTKLVGIDSSSPPPSTLSAWSNQAAACTATRSSFCFDASEKARVLRSSISARKPWRRFAKRSRTAAASCMAAISTAWP